MVLFYETKDYAFVPMRSLVAFGKGSAHDKLCHSSKSKAFQSAVLQASQAFEDTSKSAKQTRSSRRLSGRFTIKSETDEEREALTKASPIVDTTATSSSSPDLILEVPSGSESPEEDVSHYEKMRQENMRRNNEILEVISLQFIYSTLV